MRLINFGVIGVGWPGQQHAIALSAIESTKLRACADADPERLRAYTKTYQPENSFADYHELLRDPQLDAVIICLPNFLHFPASLAVLEAGKHVLCEKPPMMNAAEMKVLRDEAAKRELVFFGRQFRFTPAMRSAREIVSEGRLGKIYHAKASWFAPAVFRMGSEDGLQKGKERRRRSLPFAEIPQSTTLIRRSR